MGEQTSLAFDAPAAPDVRAAVAPTSTAETRSATAPAGLPPRRLDVCDRCGGDGEEKPRKRVFFRRYAGPLLCVDCEKVVPR